MHIKNTVIDISKKAKNASDLDDLRKDAENDVIHIIGR